MVNLSLDAATLIQCVRTVVAKVPLGFDERFLIRNQSMDIRATLVE